jgi:hypothetical protein
MKIIFLMATACLLWGLNHSLAQTSMLQDKSGETAFTVNQAKSIFVNAGDANISFALPYHAQKYFYGLDVKFKANGGVATILEGYALKPAVNAGIFYGRYFNPDDVSTISYWYTGARVNNASFNLLNNDNTNTFRSGNFTGYNLQLGYNHIGASSILQAKDIQSAFLFGISASFGRQNNLDDLRTVERTTSVTVTDSASNTQSTIVKEKKSGYEGAYQITEALRLNVDAYLYPSLLGNRIGLGGFYRGQLSGREPRSNAGLGLLAGQKGAPSNVVFGIFYQANDVFNQLGNEESFARRTALTLNVGYSF